MNPDIKFAYFGGEPLGVPVLEELKKAGLLPSLIVCNPDRPVGRSQELTAPPLKIWAAKNNIEVFQPNSYKEQAEFERLLRHDWDVFVVVAYNFILPQWFLELPKKGVLNVHPSLLPSLRGASPIRTAIKDNLVDDIGVTVMLLDEKMDHGPILEQEQFVPNANKWPLSGPVLDGFLAKMGGRLLADVLPAWVHDEISPQEQDESLATYCPKLTKSDGELRINPTKLPTGTPATICWHTIQAFEGIGQTFFIHNQKRVKIAKAELTLGGSLRLLRVIPEGKSEMDFSQYLQSIA
jgi:methionyl-tRNA formyltransferase